MMNRLLIVDDDIELCSLVTKYLRAEGYEVDAVHTGELGLERASVGEYALVVLDVMLPGMNGFEVLRHLTAKSQVPVLMLSARGEDIDRIIGLQIGADDYLPKPFNPHELVARIQAILRRSQRGMAESSLPPQEVLVVGDLELDKNRWAVNRNGTPVILTSLEFNLLEFFLKLAGRVISREELAKSVLGRLFDPFDRSIDMHVSNLRKKLGAHPDGSDRIKSIRGIGYLYTFPSNPKEP
jgi:two-component system, OmpR family, response regulator CpxR